MMAAQTPTDTSHFDWGHPGVIVPLPPTRVPIPLVVPPLSSLGCDPVGTFNLRRALGAQVPGFDRHRHRYCASDMAWTASGASEDGHHIVGPDQFFPEFNQLHNLLPAGNAGRETRTAWEEQMRRLIFDLATKYDRSTAGMTFIVHVNGTTVPNSPVVPERLKAQVYLPPHLLVDHPEIRPAVAFLMQTVIERLGIPGVVDWRWKAAHKWNLTQRGHIYPVVLPTVLVPPPINSRSAQYLFPGRPLGQLTLPAATPGPLLLGIAPEHNEDIAIFDIEELTQDDERIAYLESENMDLRSSIDVLQSLAASMQADLDDRNAEIGALSAKILRLQANHLSNTLSPSSSQHGPSTPTRRGAPPPYVPTSPTSPSPHLAIAFSHDPSQGSITLPSPRTAGPGSITLPSLLTEAFLAENGLQQLTDMVILIMRFVSSMDWRSQVRSLNGLSPDLVDGLVAAMAADHRV
ncbi:hypothetical protein C8J57DRAFT_1508632 [Mycena rebaudengoi]|nr:hypothetical protein C8J57DRAFT_1508632 [Mycena rebaudengoi]